MKNKPLLILAGILVIALIVMGYKWGSSNASNKAVKMQLKQIVKTAQVQIKGLTEENEELAYSVAEAEKTAENALEEAGDLKNDLKESKVELNELRDKLQEAKPKTLLAETRRILETKEIWYDKETQTFTFSLAAFRKQTIINAEWENFMLVEEPNYQNQIKKLEFAITNYQYEISDLKLMNLNWKEKFSIVDGAFDDYKEVVGKIKEPGFFDTILKVGLGYAAARFIETLSGR